MDDGNICRDVTSCRSEVLCVVDFCLAVSFFCCCDSLEEIQRPRLLDLYRWLCIVGFGCRVGNILGSRSHRCTLGYKIVAQLLAL